MFKLFKATAIVSIATISAVLVGAIRAKFTALTIGPAGVGIFSQACNFQQLAVTVSSLSLGLGITKYVAQYIAQRNDKKIEETILAAFLMQLAVSFVLIMAIFCFSGMFSKFLFSNYEYRFYLLASSAGMIFLVLASTIEAVLFGFGKYQAFAKGRSLSNLFSIIPLIVFIGTMGVKGGFFYLALNSVITYLIYYRLFIEYVPENIRADMFALRKIKALVSDVRRISKDLLTYGGVSFIGGILNMFNVVFVRSLLIRYFGAEANGYYQVVFTLSAYYISFFTNGLWSYFYARVSSLVEDRNAYSAEINGAIRFCIFGMVSFIVILFILKVFVVNLIFSSKFKDALALFPTQLFGDLFFMLYYIVSTSLLASARLRAYLGFGFLYSASFVGLFLLLRGISGISSITTSYSIVNLILFLSVIYYHVKNMRVVLYMRNVRLLISGAALCLIVLFVGKDSALFYTAKTTLLAAWLFFMTTGSEKKKVWDLTTRTVRSLTRAGSAS